MDARITREETALLLNLTSPVPSEAELIRLEAMRARDTAIGNGLAGAVKAVWRGLRATMAFLAAYPERLRVLRHLSALNDRELADIGLARSDLSRVFDEDFAVTRERAQAGGIRLDSAARAV